MKDDSGTVPVEVYTTGNACDDREHYETDAPKGLEISKKTLQMIDRGIEEMRKGNVSDPVDMEEDFPGLFE